MNTENIKICTKGAGCFYYLGIADNPEIKNNVGRHLCGCVNGRYESGSKCHYIDEIKKCPCGKW